MSSRRQRLTTFLNPQKQKSGSRLAPQVWMMGFLDEYVLSLPLEIVLRFILTLVRMMAAVEN